MDRSSSAKGKDGETMWVLSAFERMDARCVGHALVNNLVNAPGRLLNSKAQRIGNALLNSAASGCQVYFKLPSQEVIGIKVTKHEIGIGHRWLRPTAPIAHRARFGAR